MKQGSLTNSISTSMIDQIFRAFDGLKTLNVFLIGVATVNLVNGQLLYEENFDSYNVGDAITQVSQAFDLWPVAGATDAFVSNDASWSGANSLKIEGELIGGPMDVVLIAGLEGIYEFTFRLLVPPGASGYYNFQENIVPGVEWAFECNLNSDGTIRYAVDPLADGSDGPEFTTTYSYGSWIEIKHEFDTDANLMNTLIDGECVGELPYDGQLIGGLNFYAGGDGLTLPLYYVDDISVTTLDILPGCPPGPAGCTDFGAINFNPEATIDDGSCLYIVLGCTDATANNYNPEANVDDGFCEYDCPPDVDGVAMHPFFSEYVEGWGNNRALEIFNPTNADIDMTAYQLERYSNGEIGLLDTRTIQLMGLIEPLDVAVYTLDKQDPNGVDFEQPVWDDLAAVTDYWLNPVYEENNTMYYNGNDAMVLRHIASNQIVDVFGRVGEDPGAAGWAGMTQNHTLVRKASVAQGDTNPADEFLVVDEWVGVLWSADGELNTLDLVFDNLGFHAYCFGTASVTQGCTNPSAFNYNPSATVDDGSCIFFAANCDFIGNPAWADFAPGLYLGQSQVEHELGVYVNGEFVLHVPGTYQDGDGGSFSVLSWDNLTWSGLPEGVVLDAEPTDAEAGTQSCITYSGTPFQEGVFELTVTGDLMVSVFGNPVSAGQVTSSFTMVITPNANGILGCTYANASNYLPVATIDDGSCIYAGCMDPEASNFQIFATTDDGSCSYECAAVEGLCMFDANNDGSIGSADLLDFLTAFGVSCE